MAPCAHSLPTTWQARLSGDVTVIQCFLTVNFDVQPAIRQPAMSAAARRWLRAHAADPFVRRARRENYRSRAVFKLAEIDRRESLCRRGMTVLELGAAPGGWTQYVRERVLPGGVVVAVDRAPLADLPGVQVVNGDAGDEMTRKKIIAACGAGRAHLLLSDMAPDLTGVAATDQARGAALVEVALAVARDCLRADGVLLVKFFQGAESAAVRRRCGEVFGRVRSVKPAASRGRSREQYLLCRALKTPPAGPS